MYASAGGRTFLCANEGAKKRMGFQDASDEFEAFFGAAGMAMDGNAGLELTDERLIPVKPRYLSWQELLLNGPDVLGLAYRALVNLFNRSMEERW